MAYLDDATLDPFDPAVIDLLGTRGRLWSSLVEYLADAYDHEPVFTREGKDRALCFRYRRGGKTLVTLYPRDGEFTVLVVLGREEVAAAIPLTDRLSARVRKTFNESRQYPDGRWLWIRPAVRKDIASIGELLALKRKPKTLVSLS